MKKTNISIMILVVITVFGISSTCWSATYYVNNTLGNDNNLGTTQASPWKTVAKVNSGYFSAGDTIFFQSGQKWNEGLRPVAGKNGNPVTYTSYGSGAKPVIDNCDLTNKSHVNLSNISFISQNNYPVNMYSSTYINIHNCDIIADVNNTTAWAALFMQMNSSYNTITNCLIERRNTFSQGDAADIIRNCNYNVFQGNTFGKATHYALALEGSTATYPNHVCSFNIVRNNTFNNTEGAQIGLVSNANRNVIEGNTIMGGKASIYTNNSPHSLKNVSAYNIIRNNVIKDNPAGLGLTASAYQYSSDPPNNVIGNRIYNNVVTNINSKAVYLNNDLPSVCQVSDNVYKNNIFYNNGAADSGLQTDITQYAQGPTYFINNIIFKSGVTNVTSKSRTGYSVAGYQLQFPTEAKGNIQQDPLLDVNHKPTSGSPAINAGDWLTSVTSSSATGTSFVVADANYFTDGFGIVTGDTIRVANNSAIVTSIDYSTKTIVVDRTISWNKGDLVALPFNGLKPYIGAFDIKTLAIMPPTNLVVN